MANVVARVRDCACPGEPHPDGDVVYLLPTLGLDGGLEAESDLLESIRLYPQPDKASAAEVDRIGSERTRFLRPRWLKTFLRHGAVGWNLEDEDGPIPFDVEALLGDYSLARMAADKAADLYSAGVLAPFQAPPPKHSRNGQTDGGIPAPSTPTPLRSKRSSRASSAGSEKLSA